MAPITGRLAGLVVAIATILVLVAVGIAPFFTPLWTYPGQDRAQAEAWTGWPASTVHEVTGSVLVDLLVGPPAFAQAVDGHPVFDEAEASHLRDVRRVVLAFVVAALVAFAVVVAAWLRFRPASAFWTAVRAGATAMGVAVVVLGVFALVAFDAAFELFHRLFFAPGTYAFDPATSRLVQLFPEAFWSQTAIAIGFWLLVLAVGVARFAAGRSSTARAGEERTELERAPST